MQAVLTYIYTKLIKSISTKIAQYICINVIGRETAKLNITSVQCWFKIEKEKKKGKMSSRGSGGGGGGGVGTDRDRHIYMERERGG